MGRQHDFRMNNAALVGVVMGHTVPLVYQLFAASVGGCGNGRLALAPAGYLNTTMVNCYGIISRIGYSDLLKVNSLRSKVFAFGKYTKG